MIGKLLPRNTFILALIALFSAICLLPMNLSAHHHTDHDNIDVNDVHAQTSVGVSYNEPFASSGAYANIWNISNIPVRYYYSSIFSVYRGDRAANPFKSVSDDDKGWVGVGSWKSFYPGFSIDMSGAKEGQYTGRSSVSLLLKFDFNGDGRFDSTASVGSSCYLDFEIEFK